VVLYGGRRETGPLLSALDRAVGSHDVARFFSGVPEAKSEQRWWFASLNDAMHAVELARGILSYPGALPWRLWLSSNNQYVVAHANTTVS
jgi:hypothetical protein